jgi:hypothetical protein
VSVLECNQNTPSDPKHFLQILELDAPRERARTFNNGCTCPRYPAVPDSTSGMLPAIHIRFTCLRASTRSTSVSDTPRPLIWCSRQHISRAIRTEIVERVENNIEARKPCEIIMRIFDIAMDWRNADVRVKCCGSARCNLEIRLSPSRRAHTSASNVP